MRRLLNRGHLKINMMFSINRRSVNGSTQKAPLSRKTYSNKHAVTQLPRPGRIMNDMNYNFNIVNMMMIFILLNIVMIISLIIIAITIVMILILVIITHTVSWLLSPRLTSTPGAARRAATTSGWPSRGRNRSYQQMCIVFITIIITMISSSSSSIIISSSSSMCIDWLISFVCITTKHIINATTRRLSVFCFSGWCVFVYVMLFSLLIASLSLLYCLVLCVFPR